MPCVGRVRTPRFLGGILLLRGIVKNHGGCGDCCSIDGAVGGGVCCCSGHYHCSACGRLEWMLPATTKFDGAAAFIDGYVDVRDDGFSHRIAFVAGLCFVSGGVPTLYAGFRNKSRVLGGEFKTVVAPDAR